MRAELQVPADELREVPGSAYVSRPHGQVFLCWPDGRCSRASEDSESKWAPPFKWSLAAHGLSATDCSAIAARWVSTGDVKENRRLRLAAVHLVAGTRARQRAELLRLLRRGEQPPGSVSVARFGGSAAAPLVRFPGGGGWWVTDAAPGDSPMDASSPWAWRHVPATRLLAADLTEEQCMAAARCGVRSRGDRGLQAQSLRMALAHLAAAGLLLPQ